MVCFRRGIRRGTRIGIGIGTRRGIRIRKSQRHWVHRSISTACSADVRLGGASGGTEAHQDPHSDRGGSHGYYSDRGGSHGYYTLPPSY